MMFMSFVKYTASVTAYSREETKKGQRVADEG